MKKIYFLAIGLICFGAFSQNTEEVTIENQSFNWVITADTFYKTIPLRDIDIITDLFPDEDKEHVYNNNFRRQKFVNEDAYPNGNDPVWQKTQGEQFNKAPIQNWEGQDPGSVPDPTGAAGPNHYVQMINSTIQIFNKTGTSLMGPNAMSSILSSNAGDPIVMYDRFADRWFISGFGNGNALSMAVSVTNDPTGAYNVWEFTMSSFPDYPKYGIWHDGYYLTANKSGDDCFVVDRDAMLAGDANVDMISMTIPNLTTGTGTQTGSFHSALPAHADFTLPNSTEKLNLFYFQDDAWIGITQDEIKIWEVIVDWTNMTNSSVTEIQTLAVTPFDSQFDSGWNDIEQPGSTQKLDGVPGAFMYRAQFTEWGTHNSVMLNHTVDVDATNHAGIRWYELREMGGVWSIYQESTFAPDAESRWLGSISMDYQGNIGMAYSVSSSTVSPSLRYTGRYSTDPLNTMTLTEENIVIGSGAKSGGNRYGDYSHLSVDPTDDATFWFTGEYVNSNNTSTRIASFKLANDFNNDVGIIALTSPVNGSLTGTETVTVTLKNFGLNSQNNFPVSYQVDGGTVVTETYSAVAIAPNTTASFSFAQTGNFSTTGEYVVKAYTALTTDEFLQNDTLNTTVNHLYADDLGVTIINSPNSANNIGIETIDVTIENFGTSNQSNFDVAYTINGGTTVVETVLSTLNVGATMTYSFTTQGNFTALGIYNVIAYSDLTGDSDNFNDTTYKTIEHSNCQPAANCDWGDGFTSFELGSINNTSGCSSNGYEDYSATVSTDLTVGMSHDVTVTSGYNPQYFSMWIDYNDNFFFDATEQVINTFQSNLGATTSFNLLITATLGEHLIRVKSSDQTTDVEDPCSNMQYGETEDYMVNLVEPLDDSGIEENLNGELTIVAIQGNVYTLETSNINLSNSIIEIHNTLGQLVYSSRIDLNDTSSFQVDLSKYAGGAYLINVKNDTSNSIIKLIKK
jgi:hypothetical protein